MLPPSPPPRRSDARGTLGPVARGLYRGSIGVALLALLLLALDLGLGFQIPQPFRMALPIVFAVGLCFALALGVGAYGAPQRPAAGGGPRFAEGTGEEQSEADRGGPPTAPSR